jgi:hypothetical protein
MVRVTPRVCDRIAPQLPRHTAPGGEKASTSPGRRSARRAGGEAARQELARLGGQLFLLLAEYTADRSAHDRRRRAPARRGHGECDPLTGPSAWSHPSAHLAIRDATPLNPSPADQRAPAVTRRLTQDDQISCPAHRPGSHHKELATNTRVGEPPGALFLTPHQKGSELAPVLLQLRASNLATVHKGPMFEVSKNNARPAQTCRPGDHKNCGAKGIRTPDPLTASLVPAVP